MAALFRAYQVLVMLKLNSELSNNTNYFSSPIIGNLIVASEETQSKSEGLFVPWTVQITIELHQKL